MWFFSYVDGCGIFIFRVWLGYKFCCNSNEVCKGGLLFKNSIEKGLKPTDRVIIKGTQMAMPGQKVSAQRGRIAASAPGPDKSPEAPTSAPAASASLAS